MIWFLSALAAPCSMQVPPDTPFALEGRFEAGGAALQIVVHAEDVPDEVFDRLLATFAEREVEATWSVAAEGEPTQAERLALARAQGHEIAVRVPPSALRAHPERGPPALRKALRPYAKAYGRLRAAEVAVEHPMHEAVLHRIGIRTVLETNGPATATARRQQMLEGQVVVGAVLPAGPYAGACGTSPLAQPFTPASADRVTRALRASSRASLGFVRLTLEPRTLDEVEVLARWLDTVVLPSGVRVLTPSAARSLAVEALKARNRSQGAEPVLAGRLVPVAVLEEAAAAVLELEVLPRGLPGELGLTEAFQGFVRVLGGDVEQGMVRLSSMVGPRSRARPSEHYVVSRTDLEGLARAMLADLPETLPAALPAGRDVIPTPELLRLFAAAVHGDDPCRTEATQVPDPHAPGLGWGAVGDP